MRYFFTAVHTLLPPLLIPVAVCGHQIFSTSGVDSHSWGILLAIGILIVALPYMLLMLLRYNGHVETIQMQLPRKRVVPSILYGILLLIVIRGVLPLIPFSNLKVYFLGLLLASIVSGLLYYVRFNMSMHLTILGSALMYLTLQNIFMGQDVTWILMGLSIYTGIIASSHLYRKSHTGTELVFGMALGLVGQVLLAPLYV